MKKLLKFIGVGSCFNTKDGNNSAFFIDEKLNRLVLIDCGETTFERINKFNLLTGIDDVFILITHLHTDHVGSLSSLIFYLNFVKNIKPTVCFPDKDIITYLDIVGVEHNLYNYVIPDNYYHLISFKQHHKDNINAYGYYFQYQNYKVYYSGDSKTINDEVLDMFNNKKITEFYQDTSKYLNDVHMHISQVEQLFEPGVRSKVTLMHLDDDEEKDIAFKLGFSVARNIGDYNEKSKM